MATDGCKICSITRHGQDIDQDGIISIDIGYRPWSTNIPGFPGLNDEFVGSLTFNALTDALTGKSSI
jgi:hypothetical protein